MQMTTDQTLPAFSRTLFYSATHFCYSFHLRDLSAPPSLRCNHSLRRVQISDTVHSELYTSDQNLLPLLFCFHHFGGGHKLLRLSVLPHLREIFYQLLY